MKYKHIVFDIDGTLIDTEYAVINSLIKTITEITGSRNQRLIDVQTSLQKGETVIYHYNPKKGI